MVDKFHEARISECNLCNAMLNDTKDYQPTAYHLPQPQMVKNPLLKPFVNLKKS